MCVCVCNLKLFFSTHEKFSFNKSRLTFAVFSSLQVSHRSGVSDPQRSLHHRPVPVPVAGNALLGGECSVYLGWKWFHRYNENETENSGSAIPAAFVVFPGEVFRLLSVLLRVFSSLPNRRHAQDDKLLLSVSKRVSCECALSIFLTLGIGFQPPMWPQRGGIHSWKSSWTSDTC